MRKSVIIAASLLALVAGGAVASNGVKDSSILMTKVVDPATGCHYLVFRQSGYYLAPVSTQPRMTRDGTQFCQRNVAAK
jgi:hypothetical protein